MTDGVWREVSSEAEPNFNFFFLFLFLWMEGGMVVLGK